MYTVHIELALLANDLETGQPYIVLKEGSLPTIELGQNENIEQVTKNLFQEYTNLSYGFVFLDLLDMTSSDTHLQATYGGQMPLDTVLLKGKFEQLDTSDARFNLLAQKANI